MLVDSVARLTGADAACSLYALFVDRPPAPPPGLQAASERGHLGQVPQSTDPAERPVYGRLETYRRTEPKGGNDEHQGRNTAGA